MKKKFVCSFIFTIFFLQIFTGCFEEDKKQLKEIFNPEIKVDEPSILPDWLDGEYHDYYGTMDLLQEFQINYPNLINVFSIGESVLGRDIWCILITNENNTEEKYSCLIDGCIHGCEWEAGEACLYLAEYLLINYDKNQTIENILNSSEIYIIPLVNPDGREVDDRFNHNGIDLNRNFNIDFGRIRGTSIRIGTIFGKKVFTYRTFPRLHELIPSFPLYLLNCGRNPFSEPETQTLRDFMYELNKDDFSFYVNCHTAVHSVNTPWVAFKPPFEKTNSQIHVFDSAINWIVDNTEYEGVDINYEGESYKASGSAMDWCFKEFGIPSFTFEILSPDYDPAAGGGKHDNLVHWMKTTIPVFMFLLVNIENFYNWELPDISPPLPDGIPPEPFEIKGTDGGS